MSKIAFLFPGQGAQKAGMGKDFYDRSETARKIVDEASKLLDLDMKALCFEENEKLHQTEYTQAALVTVCLAMEQVLEERGLRPDVTAGLSLGEYCAVVAAGAMSIQEAVTTVRQRGILMETAVPKGKGSMAAVLGMDGAAVEESIERIEGVSVANYNCPGQLVITGWSRSVEKAADILKEAGARRVVLLNVSGPFHSPMLCKAGEELEKVLGQVHWQPLQIPYVTNVTADYVTDSSEIQELLSRQVASSVRWQQSMERLIKDGVDTYVEIGPGRTLAGFLRKINRGAKVFNIERWEDIDKVVEELC